MYLIKLIGNFFNIFLKKINKELLKEIERYKPNVLLIPKG